MGNRWMIGALAPAALTAATVIAGCSGTPAPDEGAQPAAPPSEVPAVAVDLGPGRRIIGPYTHRNLAVFLIADDSVTDDREFITLDEGLKAGSVQVNERGATEGRDDSQVNTLEISNGSGKWLYIEAGEVVKGGKQDRTLGRDLVLAPGAKNQPLAAYCVEQGRWEAAGAVRGRVRVTELQRQSGGFEDDMGLSTRESGGIVTTPTNPTTSPTTPVTPSAPTAPTAPSAPATTTPVTPAELLRAPATPTAPGMTFAPSGAALPPSMKMALLKSKSQSAVWRDVESQRDAWKANESASGTYMDVVRSPAVQKKIDPYLQTLKPVAAGKRAVVGVVFVRDGAIVAADEYGAPGLFQRLYPKLLAAHAREAAVSDRPSSVAVPPVEAVKRFLAEAERGELSTEATIGTQSLRMRENDRTITFDAREGDKLMHRNVLKK